MCNKESIKELKELILKEENEIKTLIEQLNTKEENLLFYKNKLKTISCEKFDALKPGTIVLFKDENDFEIKIQVIINKKGSYNALLLTNYTDNYIYMNKYTVLDYNCLYSSTLIKSLEENYNWSFSEFNEHIF